MDEKLQLQIAFTLTQRRDPALRDFKSDFIPASIAQYRDLAALRYDFPLVLREMATANQSLTSLSALVDETLEAIALDPQHDRIAQHAYAIESRIRETLASSELNFHECWTNAAADVQSAIDEPASESATRLWKAFHIHGSLRDLDFKLPSRVIRHLWEAALHAKASEFKTFASRLLFKLREILEAEEASSEVGSAPERLKAGMGAAFMDNFDFDRLSNVLTSARPAARLSEARRNRIHALISVLERQRFFPLDESMEGYAFQFESCTEAMEAYQARHDEAVDLAKCIAIAKLEVNGDFKEAIHEPLFEFFGTSGLDAEDLALFPDYLVCLNDSRIDAHERAQLVELLGTGLPFKVLLQTDDLLHPSRFTEGHVPLGLGSRQVVNTAISLTDVFVVQASAARLFALRRSFVDGLEYQGPALFSVYSGCGGETGGIPAYLAAAAATESRAFPSLIFDPSKGADWASRLDISDNPSPNLDWPQHHITFETGTLSAHSVSQAFTFADFLSLDSRSWEHFAVVPNSDWIAEQVSIQEAVRSDHRSGINEIPYLVLVDSQNYLQRAIMDERGLAEVKRCLAMWHSLQELGGIHNSHAERQLALKSASQAQAPEHEETQVEVPPVIAQAEPDSAAPSDEPYIETPRCTTCNECTQLNSKMFAYNENKQAYIKDPSAGTFRQLVEAAEGCQVGIIHPGKPKNLKEPGLEDLIQRAAVFN